MHPFSDTEITAIARLLLQHEVVLVHKKTRALALTPQSGGNTSALPTVCGDSSDYIHLEADEELYVLLFESFYIDYGIWGEEMKRLDAALKIFSDIGNYEPWLEALRATGRLGDWQAHELDVFKYYTRVALRPYNTAYLQMQ